MKQCRLIVAVLLMVLCLSACAAADEPAKYTSGDFVYILLEDGTAEITDYKGELETLVVPDMLDGHKVTSIGDGAFSKRASLTSITIPDSVSHLGANAFRRCRKLTVIRVSPDHPVLATIDGVLFNKMTKELIYYPYAFTAAVYTVPNGIRSIGDGAFYQCKSLTSIILPDSVTSIGDEAFRYCSSLTSITLPDGLTTIGNGAFSECDSLTSIAMPERVTSIGDEAFESCSSLTSITIPVGVTSIGELTFSGCISLSDITIPDGVTTIGYGAFNCCTSLTSITIPDGVTSIGDKAFVVCSSLTSITIPNSVVSIGNEAFASCSSSLIFTVMVDSYAEQWCRKNGLSYAFTSSTDWLLN